MCDRVRLAVGQEVVTLRQVSTGLRSCRLWPVTVLVMQADVAFWDLLVFDGIDDVDVVAVTAVFGTVDVVAGGRNVVQHPRRRRLIGKSRAAVRS